MKILIENLKTQERRQGDEHLEAYRDLIQSLMNEQAQNLITDELEQTERKERPKEYTQMINKFKWLKFSVSIKSS